MDPADLLWLQLNSLVRDTERLLHAPLMSAEQREAMQALLISIADSKRVRARAPRAAPADDRRAVPDATAGL
jgi:hypothetical protein